MASDDETPLSATQNKNPTNFTKCNIVILWALITIITSFGTYKIDKLSKTLKQNSKNLASLSDVVKAQQLVINRFNNSISNEDVVQKLTSMENEMTMNTQKLQSDLEDTKTYIEKRLENTISDLDTTVNVAKAEINEDVAKVQKDIRAYAAATSDQFSAENSFMVYQVAGTFTLLGTLISMWHMTSHLRRFEQPEVQRKVLSILWMVPIYTITSWLSLVFVSISDYLGIIKDLYESYVIYMFLSFLISVIGRGNRETVVDVLSTNDHLPRPIGGMCCGYGDLQDTHEIAAAVLHQCQAFTMQFVFWKPVCSISDVVFDKFYGWESSHSDYTNPRFWVFVIENISISTAFYGLVKFYHAVEEELYWCRPLSKFLCIKGVVFMTFWQGMVISILASTSEGHELFNQNNESNHTDDISASLMAKRDPNDWSAQSQNFLICLEMLLFAIFHYYCFPTEEWKAGYRPAAKRTKFGDNLALRDFVKDLKVILAGNNFSRKQKNNNLTSSDSNINGDDDDDTALLSVGENDVEAAVEYLEPEVKEAAKKKLEEMEEQLNAANDSDDCSIAADDKQDKLKNSTVGREKSVVIPDESTSLLSCNTNAKSYDMLKPSIFSTQSPPPPTQPPPPPPPSGIYDDENNSPSARSVSFLEEGFTEEEAAEAEKLLGLPENRTERQSDVYMFRSPEKKD